MDSERIEIACICQVGVLEGFSYLVNVLEVAAAWKVAESYGMKSKSGFGLCAK